MSNQSTITWNLFFLFFLRTIKENLVKKTFLWRSFWKKKITKKTKVNLQKTKIKDYRINESLIIQIMIQKKSSNVCYFLTVNDGFIFSNGFI